jgi:hypothetical protein
MGSPFSTCDLPPGTLNEQITVPFQAGKNGGPWAGCHQLFLIALPEDLKEFQTGGTEMGAPVNGVRDEQTALTGEEARPEKIGMIGRLRKE